MGPAWVLSLLPVQDYTCNKLIFRLLSDSVLQVTHLLIPPLVRQRPSEPGLQGGMSPFPCSGGRGRLEGTGSAPAPPPPAARLGSACLGHMSLLSASPGQAPCHPLRPRCPPSGPPPPTQAACLSPSSGRLCGAALRCLHPGLGRGPRRSRPPRPVPGPHTRARAMGFWLPPPPAPPG